MTHNTTPAGWTRGCTCTHPDHAAGANDQHKPGNAPAMLTVTNDYGHTYDACAGCILADHEGINITQTPAENTNPSGLNWTRCKGSNYPSTLRLETEIADGYETLTLELWTTPDYYTHEIQPLFILRPARGRGRIYSSDNTNSWPQIEKYLDREYWPAEHFHGKGNVDAMVADAMADAWAEAEASQ